MIDRDYYEAHHPDNYVVLKGIRYPLVKDVPCTCPSGDGSLRWPCPSHPPEKEENE